MATFDAGLSVKNEAKLLFKKVSDGLQSGDEDESKKTVYRSTEFGPNVENSKRSEKESGDYKILKKAINKTSSKDLKNACFNVNHVTVSFFAKSKI